MLGRFTVEFGYGDVLSRPALGLKTRQLCTVAALAALGNAAPPLRYHIHAALVKSCHKTDHLVEPAQAISSMFCSHRI